MEKRKSHTSDHHTKRSIGDDFLTLVMGGVVPIDPEDPPADPDE